VTNSQRFLLWLSVIGLGACSSGHAPAASGPRALPPDSAAILSAAIALARPAFATQEEALASAFYAPSPGLTASSNPRPDRSARGQGGSYVIQIAAYRDWSTAQSAADHVRRQFPELEVRIDPAADVLRVSVGGWASPGAARTMLASVRSYYPDAWVRVRPSP
jgi:hypothetical protein